jgi:IS30 family transposase
MDDKISSELTKYMKGILAVQVHSLIKVDDSIKPEVLLARAGMSAREIAEILGKSQAAVAKTIERAKKATKTAESQAPAAQSNGQDASEEGVV